MPVPTAADSRTCDACVARAGQPKAVPQCRGLAPHTPARRAATRRTGMADSRILAAAFSASCAAFMAASCAPCASGLPEPNMLLSLLADVANTRAAGRARRESTRSGAASDDARVATAGVGDASRSGRAGASSIGFGLRRGTRELGGPRPRQEPTAPRCQGIVVTEARREEEATKYTGRGGAAVSVCCSAVTVDEKGERATPSPLRRRRRSTGAPAARCSAAAAQRYDAASRFSRHALRQHAASTAS